jgi:hypothetical protein
VREIRPLPAFLFLLAALPALAAERAVFVPAGGGSVDAECAAPASAGCTAALERLARRAADDLTLVANSGKAEVKAKARDAATLPFASLRASAASALGRLSPGPEDTALLAALLNDAVPLVRRSAKGALDSSSDPAARRLAQRVRASQGDKATPQPVPTAEQLKVPLWAGAQFLFYASSRHDGVAEFATPDAAEKVAAFYEAKYGKAQSVDEFEASAKAGQKAMPDFSSQAYQDQMKAAMDAQKAYADALKAGKSPQEASQAMVAAMSKIAPANPERIRDTLRNNKEIYGAPKLFVVEKGMMPGAPNRLVAVYRDLLLGRTGIAVFTAPMPEE